MPGGGECWANVIDGIPSEMQLLVTKTAALAPVMRQEGKKVDNAPNVGLGKGRQP